MVKRRKGKMLPRPDEPPNPRPHTHLTALPVGETKRNQADGLLGRRELVVPGLMSRPTLL